MTRYRVHVMGYQESRTFHVRAKSLEEASRKTKEKLGLDFAQYFIEEGSPRD